MRGQSPFHPVPELSYGEARDLKQTFGAAGQPGLKVKRSLVTSDDNVRVQDYFHLSAGILNVWAANSYSRGNWQLERPAVMGLPAVVVKAGLSRCIGARLVSGRVDHQAPPPDARISDSRCTGPNSIQQPCSTCVIEEPHVGIVNSYSFRVELQHEFHVSEMIPQTSLDYFAGIWKVLGLGWVRRPLPPRENTPAF